jgi:hypothetical protein
METKKLLLICRHGAVGLLPLSRDGDKPPHEWAVVTIVVTDATEHYRDADDPCWWFAPKDVVAGTMQMPHKEWHDGVAMTTGFYTVDLTVPDPEQNRLLKMWCATFDR